MPDAFSFLIEVLKFVGIISESVLHLNLVCHIYDLLSVMHCADQLVAGGSQVPGLETGQAGQAGAQHGGLVVLGGGLAQGHGEWQAEGEADHQAEEGL